MFSLILKKMEKLNMNALHQQTRSYELDQALEQ